MAKIKGTGIAAIRKIVKSRGRDFENSYLSLLSEEEKERYHTALPVAWQPLNPNEDNNVTRLAALMFPGDGKGLQKLGALMCKESFSTFYQIFIRIPTPQFIFKRVAALWSRFYDQGEASIETEGGNRATLIVRKFPDYPQYLREYMCGYLLGMGELANMKNLSVRKDESEPHAWKWHLQWE